MIKFLSRLALVALAAVLPTMASAAVTFGASVTNANGSLSTRLTWDAPGATGCTASGHPSWTGAKPASGSLDLPPITLSGTYSLTLSCATAGNGQTLVKWTAVLTNTDGTALTNLAGFKVVYGTSATALSQSKAVTSATATSADMGVLPAGSYFFAVRQVNAAGVESDNSTPLVTKTVTAASSENASVSLTVNPIPKAASAVSVE